MSDSRNQLVAIGKQLGLQLSGEGISLERFNRVIAFLPKQDRLSFIQHHKAFFAATKKDHSDVRSLLDMLDDDEVMPCVNAIGIEDVKRVLYPSYIERVLNLPPEDQIPFIQLFQPHHGDLIQRFRTGQEDIIKLLTGLDASNVTPFLKFIFPSLAKDIDAFFAMDAGDDDKKFVALSSLTKRMAQGSLQIEIAIALLSPKERNKFIECQGQQLSTYFAGRGVLHVLELLPKKYAMVAIKAIGARAISTDIGGNLNMVTHYLSRLSPDEAITFVKFLNDRSILNWIDKDRDRLFHIINYFDLPGRLELLEFYDPNLSADIKRIRTAEAGKEESFAAILALTEKVMPNNTVLQLRLAVTLIAKENLADFLHYLAPNLKKYINTIQQLGEFLNVIPGELRANLGQFGLQNIFAMVNTVDDLRTLSKYVGAEKRLDLLKAIGRDKLLTLSADISDFFPILNWPESAQNNSWRARLNFIKFMVPELEKPLKEVKELYNVDPRWRITLLQAANQLFPDDKVKQLSKILMYLIPSWSQEYFLRLFSVDYPSSPAERALLGDISNSIKTPGDLYTIAISMPPIHASWIIHFGRNKLRENITSIYDLTRLLDWMDPAHRMDFIKPFGREWLLSLCLVPSDIEKIAQLMDDPRKVEFLQFMGLTGVALEGAKKVERGVPRRRRGPIVEDVSEGQKAIEAGGSVKAIEAAKPEPKVEEKPKSPPEQKAAAKEESKAESKAEAPKAESKAKEEPKAVEPKTEEKPKNEEPKIAVRSDAARTVPVKKQKAPDEKRPAAKTSAAKTAPAKPAEGKKEKLQTSAAPDAKIVQPKPKAVASPYDDKYYQGAMKELSGSISSAYDDYKKLKRTKHKKEFKALVTKLNGLSEQKPSDGKTVEQQYQEMIMAVQAALVRAQHDFSKPFLRMGKRKSWEEYVTKITHNKSSYQYPKLLSEVLQKIYQCKDPIAAGQLKNHHALSQVVSTIDDYHKKTKTTPKL